MTIQDKSVRVEEKKKIAFRVQGRVVEFHEVPHLRSTKGKPNFREEMRKKFISIGIAKNVYLYLQREVSECRYQFAHHKPMP